VANGVNQRRITDLFSQPTDEHFDQLRVVLMRVFPNAFGQLRSRKDAAEFPISYTGTYSGLLKCLIMFNARYVVRDAF
jgi:hypothetical protein